MVLLHHLHLPGLTSYAHASHLQNLLVTRLLKYKAALSKTSTSTLSSHPSSSSLVLNPPLPPPTILSFTPHPIYTTGRRETTPPSAAQLKYLTQPLDTTQGLQTAEFEHVLRGGQITFHGPGQLVVYPILSLAHPYSFDRPKASAVSKATKTGTDSIITTTPDFCSRSTTSLSPRCYVSLLESTTIATLARYSLTGIRTSNPGVWIDEDNKIAALGVHLRRNVTSHGVGLNVDTDLRWFERIVACGLEGKGVTGMRREVERGVDGEGSELGMDVEDVAGVWVKAFAAEVGGEVEVVRVTEENVLRDWEGG